MLLAGFDPDHADDCDSQPGGRSRGACTCGGKAVMQSNESWRVREVVGAVPNSIGYVDHPDRRLAARIESVLNKGAADGYTLDRIERHGSYEAIVVMRAAVALPGTEK